jgi:hypothetical protein
MSKRQSDVHCGDVFELQLAEHVAALLLLARRTQRA